MTHHMLSPADAGPPVQMFVHPDRASSQSVPPPALVQLVNAITHHHRVVEVDSSPLLDRKHPIQIFARAADKCTPFLLRPYREALIELCSVLFS
jgi:hypothetical protein